MYLHILPKDILLVVSIGSQRDTPTFGGIGMQLWADIEQMYQVRILHRKKIRKGLYRIETNEYGAICVKQFKQSERRVEFIIRVMQQLCQQGFLTSPRIISTPRHQSSIRIGENHYVLSNWVQGRSPNFKNLSEWRSGIQTLAKFHLLAEGFLLTEVPKERKNYDAIFKSVKRAKRVINKVIHAQLKYTYLSHWVDVFAEHVQEKSVQKAILAEKRKGAFIHGDYNYPNLVRGQDGRIHIIDFDNASMQGRMVDFAHLLHRSATWNAPRMIQAIEEYQKIRPLSPEDMHFLFALLHMPYPVMREYRINGAHHLFNKLHIPTQQHLIEYSKQLTQALVM